jgi:16S rRNA (cytosine967-C5)-methyltransferase
MRALDERPPLTLRTTTSRLTREALADRLRTEEALTARPTRHAPEGLVVEGGGNPAAWQAYLDGAFAVQDEASMLIARLLAPEPGETVADVCAAPGTKALHLAQLMGDRGRVLAFDPNLTRLERIAPAAQRLGVTCVQAFPGDVETLAPGFRDACDRVLVDAPCSNLGVVRRNPEVKWRRRPEDLASAAARQVEILCAAVTLLRPGGVLVYATCSLEPEENEAVVGSLRGRTPDLALDPPAAFPIPLDADGFLRCLPHRHGTDGFTAVRLRRRSRGSAS